MAYSHSPIRPPRKGIYCSFPADTVEPNIFPIEVAFRVTAQHQFHKIFILPSANDAPQRKFNCPSSHFGDMWARLFAGELGNRVACRFLCRALKAGVECAEVPRAAYPKVGLILNRLGTALPDICDEPRHCKCGFWVTFLAVEAPVGLRNPGDLGLSMSL